MDFSSPRITAVLPEIFKFLPVEDRRSIRLTCHQLKHACDHPQIVKREKFVFRPSHDEEDDLTFLAASIRDCKIIRSHFEFHGLSLWQFPSSVWERCGNHVKSLFIHECELADWTIFDIILHCSDLISFHVQSLNNHVYGRNEIFCSKSALDDLIRLNVERKSLRSFKLFSPFDLPNEMCRRIFQIYPNIRTFGKGCSLWCDRHRRVMAYDNDYHQYKYSRLQFPPTVENFSYVSFTDNALSWMNSFSDKTSPKLKQLEITLSFEIPAHSNAARNFFFHQTELERIALIVTGGSEGQMKAFLLYVLNCSSKLKTFQFCTYDKITLNLAETEEFFRKISRLESFDVDFGQFDYDSDSSWLELRLPALRFTKLTKLRACCAKKGVEKIYPEILNRCCFLQHLSLGPIDIEMNCLLKLFRNHSQLRTLRLSCERNTDCRDAPKYRSVSSSICRLENLEKLEFFNMKYPMLVMLLSEFDFPSLKYFHDGSRRKESETFSLLNIVSTKAPSLDYLELDSAFSLYLLGTDEFAAYLGRIERLKFLCIPIKDACPEKRRWGIENLFVEYLSLSYVESNDEFLYFYHRSSKTLKWHKKYKAPPFYADRMADSISAPFLRCPMFWPRHWP